MTRLALVSALLILGAGCASAPPPVAAVAGSPFALLVGQEAALGDHRIRFVDVVEDTRCPAGAACAREGRARIAVAVDGRTVTLELPARNGTAAPATAAGVEVAAVALRPAPHLIGARAPVEAVLVARAGR